MKKLFLASSMMALATTALFTSCKKEETTTGGTSTVQFMLTDGPGNYDAVLVDIKSIEVNTSANGWQTIPVSNPGVYNILDFNNGLDTLLCTATLPVGDISQIRLVLGANNSVVVDGITHSLATPSAQQSGLKLNVHQTLQAGKTYRMWLDFDAARSIVQQGNGSYSLKPVIRTFTDLTDGRIEGYVLPAAALPVVWAINGTDTMSAMPDANGRYMFCGMPAANYTVVLDADANTLYQDSTINNVAVSFGNVTNLGTVTLHQ